MASIMAHVDEDWCHVCGVRRFDLADVTFPENAEHPDGQSDKYLRICVGCAEKIKETVETCVWKFENGHGGTWVTSCGYSFDSDDFGCSSIKACPNCNKPTKVG